MSEHCAEFGVNSSIEQRLGHLEAAPRIAWGEVCCYLQQVQQSSAIYCGSVSAQPET